jgi:hypothetical protein
MDRGDSADSRPSFYGLESPGEPIASQVFSYRLPPELALQRYTVFRHLAVR